MAAQWLPLLCMIFYLGVGVGWRGWLQYRRYGQAGIVVFRYAGWRRQIRDLIFCLLLTGLMLQSALFATGSEMFSAELASTTLGWRLAGGAFVVMTGLALTVAAQLGMGASWRIGIDHDAAPGLITGGLYQFCRNPIYLGMLISLTGMVLLLPTWVSLALTLGIVWSVRSQTLEEEVYLERTYGPGFRLYASRVGRFWPGLGKLAVE